VADHGDWGGKPIVSEADWRKGTEYGGVGGVISPLDSPHTESMAAAEQLAMIYNTEPTATDDVLVEVPKKLA
jgi:hypothetical protein